jgi:FkbM family methyltransferase
MLMRLKKILNRFGYDVKKYRPVFETTVLPLGIETVLDIGANTGKVARELREMFPTAHIHSFEPLPACFTKLSEAMRGDTHFTAYNIALGETDGTMMIEESSFHPSSSLLPMTALHKKLYPKSAGSVKKQIQVKKLDDVMRGVTLSKNIFIKMDVQGYEDHVIRGGSEVVKRASVIQIETAFVTLYEGQPLFDDIYRLLSPLGFAYYGDVGRHYSPETSKLIYEESLFIKKELVRA